ncbi:hypothetical protein ACFVX9_13720 [Kitasatospora sp. NPDC058243]|uniref:hypothetical protein n=1 Tax=Kitasatospora sp. NPDC058243 TaxID=3346397 RepID=UPI0036DBBBD4
MSSKNPDRLQLLFPRKDERDRGFSSRVAAPFIVGRLRGDLGSPLGSASLPQADDQGSGHPEDRGP